MWALLGICAFESPPNLPTANKKQNKFKNCPTPKAVTLLVNSQAKWLWQANEGNICGQASVNYLPNHAM